MYSETNQSSPWHVASINANIVDWEKANSPDSLSPQRDTYRVEPINILAGTLELSGASEKQKRELLKLGGEILKLQLTADVHTESPRATRTMEPVANKKFTNPSPRASYRDIYPEYSKESEPMMRQSSVKEGLEPVTLSERRQDYRNAKRQAKANLVRSGRQYRLKSIYGKSIGTAGFEDEINSTRRSFLQRRRSKKAHREFRRLERVASINERRVQSSAQGRDIPGVVIAKRLEKKRKKFASTLDRIYDSRASSA